MVSTEGNQDMVSAKAIDVKVAPSYVAPLISTTCVPYSKLPGALYITITKAVNVQMTTVSIKGSNSATKPSDAEYLVLTAECAIEADPAPASFENAALLNPITNTPIKPPNPACGLKACDMICENAVPI